MFGEGSFYAKITIILRRTDGSTVGDLSTLVLHVQGGTGDASQPALDVAIGETTIFGDNTNAFPWDPLMDTGQRGISISPLNTATLREYSYDIFIELTTACGGKVTKITRDLTQPTRLDDGDGGQTDMTTFDY
jgi:hypothetical protein